MTTHDSPAYRLLSQSAAERKKTEADREMGMKVIATLTVWYDNTIAPLEARVALLERPWWRKLLDRVYRQRDTAPEAE